MGESEFQGLCKTQTANKAASEIALRLLKSHSGESVVTNVITQLFDKGVCVKVFEATTAVWGLSMFWCLPYIQPD